MKIAARHIRRRASWLPAFFSISLVLFLAGLFGLFIIHADTLKNYIKENVQLSIYFKDNVTQADILSLQKKLEAQPYIKNVRYISKEAGLKLLNDEVGGNQEAVLGFNPIPNALDIYFKPDYVTPDSLAVLKKALEKNNAIREVSYDVPVVENIDRNVRIAGIILLGIALFMAMVSIALINNTIRLTLYSKRFVIKSMQLVGATRRFIRRPFIYRGAFLGLGSSFVACGLLLAALYLAQKNFPGISQLSNPFFIGILLLAILALGIIISALSSYFATNKYLRMKLDDLF